MDELRRLKHDSGMTNRQIASLSGVPLGTVNRVMAGHAKNPGYETVSAMRDAMSADVDSDPPPVASSDDCNSCHTCPRGMPTGADFQRLSDNFMELKSRVEASFADALASKDRQFDKTRAIYDGQLKRIQHWLVAVSVFLALQVLALLALYIYDISNPTRGYFVLPTSTISIPTATPDA